MIDENIHIAKIDQKGHYGVSFLWNDGHHADIFSYDILKSIAIEIRAE